jgi:hypothetical protein
MRPIFAEWVNGDSRWQVCLADCPDYLSYEALADLLYTEHLRGLEHTDILIVRPRVDRPGYREEEDKAGVEALYGRAPRASLHILYSEGYHHRLTKNRNLRAEDRLPAPSDRSACLNWLQDKELYYYVKESSALFKANSNFVYRAPSDGFVNMFLRVGNVQRNRQVLDAFFFWMLPHLKGRDAVLVETWSVSSIALNVGRFLERYWMYEAENTENPREKEYRQCRVDMLSSYPDRYVGSLPETIHALRRMTENGKRNVLVVLSAVNSGNSLKRLREAIADAQVRDDEFAFLALYKLNQQVDVPFLCDLSSGEQFAPVAREDVGGRTVIEIDRSAYFPLHIEETPLTILPGDASGSNAFFTRYRDSSILSLHRNAVDLSRQEQRHHGIYIDVARMLANQLFRERLATEVDGIAKRPVLVVAPPHTAGKMLADAVRTLLRSRFPGELNVHIHPDLNPRGQDIPEALRNSAPDDLLLIVDDVSITGQRLSRYQQNLREIGYVGRIVYLVGVARPTSKKSWRQRIVHLEYRRPPQERHRVVCIESVILPDWDSKQCPWCAEAAGLATLLRNGRLGSNTSSQVASRISALNKARINEGLVDNAIWRPVGLEGVHLTQGSLFLDLNNHESATDADVVASVAAVLQHMRTARSEGQRLEATYPHVSVLGQAEYLSDKFNDDILRFAILRSAYRDELERWTFKEESDRRDEVTRFLSSRDNLEVFRLEFAIARLAGKIPDPDITYDEWRGKDGWPAELWQELVKAKQNS